MNILIAEDDDIARMTLDAVLKGFGYDVTAAEQGAEAWADLQLGHFPIVISDWEMPEMSGPELCRRIRARSDPRYTYFILVTATGGKQRYLEGMDAGADDFITKPVDMDELRARLKGAERMLGLRHHVQQLEGLLPICAYCKRIRGGNEEWESIERYVEERSEAQFSHGYCPDCYEKYVRPQIEGGGGGVSSSK
jgi:sigma-B regulation protein RsbU (phosphoserine phosphatase)